MIAFDSNISFSLLFLVSSFLAFAAAELQSQQTSEIQNFIRTCKLKVGTFMNGTLIVWLQKKGCLDSINFSKACHLHTLNTNISNWYKSFLYNITCHGNDTATYMSWCVWCGVACPTFPPGGPNQSVWSAPRKQEYNHKRRKQLSKEQAW